MQAGCTSIPTRPQYTFSSFAEAQGIVTGLKISICRNHYNVPCTSAIRLCRNPEQRLLATSTAGLLCRSCVEKAAAVGTPNAIRYVRRAAELCDALATPVPGLCQECVDYIKAHPSNVYDMAALHLFAKGLKAAGQKDKAAAVYFTLLEVKSTPLIKLKHESCNLNPTCHKCSSIPFLLHSSAISMKSTDSDCQSSWRRSEECTPQLASSCSDRGSVCVWYLHLAVLGCGRAKRACLA